MNESSCAVTDEVDDYRPKTKRSDGKMLDFMGNIKVHCSLDISPPLRVQLPQSMSSKSPPSLCAMFVSSS